MNLKSKIKKIFSFGKKDDNINHEKSLLNESLDFSKDLIVIVIIVLLIRTFLAMPFQIS
jgi:signal peptidase I